MQHRLPLSVITVAALVASSAPAELLPQYEITTFGLTDAFHTYGDRSVSFLGVYQTTSAPASPLHGFADAYQDDYTGSNIPGRSVWAYDGSTTSEIGLSTGIYRTTSNYTYSQAAGQSASGAIVGTSRTYSGSTQNGQASWVYSGGSTTLIASYAGRPYTSPMVAASSHLVSGSAMNTSNYLSGTTDRHAWVYDGSSTLELGYYDAMHTASGAKHNSYGSAPAGNYVRGYSTRYAGGSASLGQTAWIYNGSTGVTSSVGYTGGSYSYGDRQFSAVAAINTSGTATGTSYNNYDVPRAGFLGSTAWLRSASGSMMTLALPGSQYESPTGIRVEQPIAINSAGEVAGYSSANWSTTAADFTGREAWRYSQGTYQVIPTPTTPFTAGYSTTMQPVAINENGDVAGMVYRKSGTTTIGGLPWVYRNGTVYQTGLFDALHTGLTGRTSQSIALFSDSGLATGTAFKIDSQGNYVGWDTWVFDPQSESTVAMALSNRIDGSTTPLFITPEGFVGGYYEDYVTETGTNFTYGGFLWSHDTGYVDLNSLVPGGLASLGIEQVAVVNWVSPEGEIYASVQMTDGSMRAAVLQAAVPEPGIASLLAGVTLFGLGGRTRRRQ